MWGLLFLIGVALSGLYLLSLMVVKLTKSLYIPGIPVAKGHWLWGHLKTHFPGFDQDVSYHAHSTILELHRQLGPVVQCSIFGHLIVMISDATLGKYVLENIKGKGNLQSGEMAVRNIFTMETGPDWRKRRNKFRHAFNQSALRRYDAMMGSLVDRFNEILVNHAKNQETVAIDELFGRFALDTVFLVGFEMEIDFLGNRAVYEVISRKKPLTCVH